VNAQNSRYKDVFYYDSFLDIFIFFWHYHYLSFLGVPPSSLTLVIVAPPCFIISVAEFTVQWFYAESQLQRREREGGRETERELN
jgi:hypothetical protein